MVTLLHDDPALDNDLAPRWPCSTVALLHMVTLLLCFVPCKPPIARPGLRLVPPKELSPPDPELSVRPGTAARAPPGAPHSLLQPCCPSTPQTPPAAAPGAGGSHHPLHGHGGSRLGVQLWGGYNNELQTRSMWPLKPPVTLQPSLKIASFLLFPLLWCRPSASGEPRGWGWDWGEHGLDGVLLVRAAHLPSRNAPDRSALLMGI